MATNRLEHLDQHGNDQAAEAQLLRSQLNDVRGKLEVQTQMATFAEKRYTLTEASAAISSAEVHALKQDSVRVAGEQV